MGLRSGHTGQGGDRLEGWQGGWVCRAVRARKKWASGDTDSDSHCSNQARFQGAEPHYVCTSMHPAPHGAGVGSLKPAFRGRRQD